MARSGWIAALILSVVGIAAYLSGAGPAEELLQRHRNLGKAFYENPTTHAEAIAELKKALDLAPNSVREKLNYGLALLHGDRTAEGVAALQDVQKRDPSLPHSWFNLGIYYKKTDDLPKAAAQFAQMVKLAPNEPIGHYQLAAILRIQGHAAEAIAQFEQASKLDPLLAAAHFQLYNLYRQAGRQPDATRELEAFQNLKKQQEGAAIPEDVDWCRYAELYEPPQNAAATTSAGEAEDRPLEGAVDPATAGMTVIDSAGTGQADLLVWSARGVQLYRRGVELAKDSGLEEIGAALFIAPGDFDNDGLMDLCILTESGPLLYRNTKGRFTLVAADLPKRRFVSAVWLDYDHDYDLDLVLLGDTSALMRNQGAAGFADRTADFPFAPFHARSAEKLRVDPDSKAFDLAVYYDDRAVLYLDELGGRYRATPHRADHATPRISTDFNNDGRPDSARVSPDGKVHLMLGASRNPSRWLRVQLAGVKSLKLAQDAEVEIKAGTLYRREWYAGVPLLFDAGDTATVDVVRITWPNGLIQNETQQASNKSYKYEEAQRLSGSCPMIWTWNGREFQFITDVLGVAPLGASDGEGTYFPVDHDEYVQIPGAALQPVNGRYELRITEELSEVSYLDQVQLFTVDHPADEEIYTNEKFKGPPYPEFRLFAVEHRTYPQAAYDDARRDVLPALLARDQRYPDRFPRTPLGVAQPHSLELDFTGAADGVLLLNGWVDWPDGSTFRAAAQERPGGLIMPYLQMQNAAGAWTTVNEDMGMPAGKPKTIAVPLHWISSARKLRIVTNLCVYWDEIFLSQRTAPPAVRQQTAPLISADLHFRGFSEAHIDAQRKQPDTYTYGRLQTMPFWNATPGFYTRYGDVRELAGQLDDRLILMGSGDELRLTFEVPPPPPAGWRREYLLKVDGWAKDRDPNTAFSSTVEPLPFHGMSRYPYPAAEHFPQDAAHDRYRREFNTRPALRFIPPLRYGS